MYFLKSHFKRCKAEGIQKVQYIHLLCYSPVFVVIAITATVLEYSSVDPRLSLRSFERHATHIHQLIQEEFSFTITKKVSRLYFLTMYYVLPNCVFLPHLLLSTTHSAAFRPDIRSCKLK